MSTIDYDAELTKAGAHIEGGWGTVFYLVRRHPLGAIGGAILFVFMFCAIFADIITVFDPLSVNAGISLARPSAYHWLGADYMGRDVYSRIVYGARISLAVGIGSTALGSVLGALIGLPSGSFGGVVGLL